MAKVVDVPGVGQFSLPDGTTDAQAQQFIQKVSSAGSVDAAISKYQEPGQGGVPIISPLLSGAVTGLAEIPTAVRGIFDKKGAEAFRQSYSQAVPEFFGMDPTKEQTPTEMLAGGVGSLIPMLGASVISGGAAAPLLAARLGLAGTRALSAAEKIAAAGKLASGVRKAQLLGGAAAAVPLGMGTAQQMATDYERRTGESLTPGQYAAVNIGGAGIGLFDLAPLGRWAAPIAEILQKVPASKALEASKIVNNAKSRFLGKVAAGAGMEGGQEAVSQIAQNLLAAGIYDPEQSVTESVAENFALGAGVGGIVEGLVLSAAGIKRRKNMAAGAQLDADVQKRIAEAQAGVTNQQGIATQDTINSLQAENPITGADINSVTTELTQATQDLEDAKSSLERVKSNRGLVNRRLGKMTIPFDSMSTEDIRDLAVRLNVKPKEGKDLVDSISKMSKPKVLDAIINQQIDVMEARVKNAQRRFDMINASGTLAPRESVSRSNFRVDYRPDTPYSLGPVARAALSGGLPETPDQDVRSVKDAARIVGDLRKAKSIPGPRPDTSQMSEEEMAALVKASNVKTEKGEPPEYTIDQMNDDQLKKAMLSLELQKIRSTMKDRDRFAVVEEQYDGSGNKIGEAVVRRYNDKASAEKDVSSLKEASDPLAYQARMAPLGKKIKNVMAGMGLADVGFKFQQIMEDPNSFIEGQYDPRQQVISLVSGIYEPGMSDAQLEAKLVSVLNHEVIHAIRDLGLFTNAEWNTLTRAAATSKMPGKSYTAQEYVERLRPDILQDIENGVPGSTDLLQEESVAEYFRNWMANGKKPAPASSLLSRILNFFKRMFGFVKTNKAEGIFEAIASGEIGNRARKKSPEPMPKPEPYVAPPQAPEEDIVPPYEDYVGTMYEGRTEEAPIRKMRKGKKAAPVAPVAPQDIAPDAMSQPVEDIPFSFSTEGYGDQNVRLSSKVDLSQEADRAFRQLARAQQSGEPEMYMEFAQNALREYESGPALTYAMEHVGDLTHRMAQYGNEYPHYEFGIEFVEPKVRAGLRVVTNRVDGERIAKLPDHPTLKNYADAHAKLKVYNEAQRAARDAAVALGRKDLKEAERNLLILQDMIDNGTYVEIAGSYDPNYEGKDRKFSKVNIESPEFKRWFRDSKLVDENGDPLTFYHGTWRNFSEFGKSKSAALSGEEGPFFFAYKPEFASDFAMTDLTKGGTGRARGAGRVIPVYISSQNPWGPKIPGAVDELVRELQSRIDAGDIPSDASFKSNIGGRQKWVKDGRLTDKFMEQIRFAHWPVVEIPAVQKAIRDLGYDGFFMTEGGVVNFAVFNANQVKSIFNQFEPGTAESRKFSKVDLSKLDPADYMPSQFLPISTINLLHRAVGPALDKRFKGGFRSSKEAGRYIEQLWDSIREDIRRRGGNIPANMSARNDENADLISDFITAEAIAALQKDGNAIGWYDAKLKAAKRVMALIHPEILTDPKAEAIFDTGIAITSNGAAVVDNFKEGLRQYEYYKKHNRFEEVGLGKQKTGIVAGFKAFNKMVDAIGFDNTVKFMNTEFEVRELRKLGFKLAGESAGTKVYGSFIFGPKIGQGFWQNLRGNYDPLTADRWFMRMWNRLTGRPFEARKSDEVMLRNRLALKEALLNKGELSKVDSDVVKDAAEKFFGTKNYIGKLRKLNPRTEEGAEELDSFLITVEKRYQSYFTKFTSTRKDKSLKPEKSDLMKALGTHRSNVEGELQEDPKNGSEREYIRQVVSQARSKLKRLGIDINTADLQALVWYPEKQLWRERFGVRPGRGEDNDYSDAAVIVAKENGIKDAEIQKALTGTNGQGVRGVRNDGRGVPKRAAESQKALRSPATEQQRAEITDLVKKYPKYSAVAVPLNPSLQAAYGNAFAAPAQRTFFERLTDFFTGNAGLRFVQSVFNQDQVIEYDEKAVYGKRIDASMSATASIAMARRAGFVSGAAIFHGIAPVQFRNAGDVQSAYIRAARPDEDAPSIVKIMAPIYEKGLQKQFSLYGIARRAKSKPGKQIVNLTDQQINDAIALDKQYPELKTAFEEYQKHNRSLIKMAVDSGRIEQGEADAMLEDLNYYGAYRVYEGELASPKSGGTVGGGSTIEKLSGQSDQKILDDPIELMIRNQTFWINASMKNLAALKAANLAVKAGEAVEVKGTAPTGAYTMVAYENGKKKTYMFNGPKADLWYNSLRSNDRQDWGKAMELFGLPAKWLRYSVTHDPSFILANLFRDALSTWGLRGEKVAPWKTFTEYVNALKGDSSIDAMRALGVGGGYDVSMKDPADQAKIVNGTLNKGVYTVTDPMKLVGALMQRLENLSEASDAATRAAVFKKVMEETGDEAEAAYRALEVMNFTKQGSSAIVQGIAKIVPFFNAMLQGKLVLGKSIKAAYKGVSKGGFDTLTDEERRLGKGMLLRGTVMAGVAMMLEMMNQDDDEYEDRIAPYLREQNFIIPLKSFGMPGTFIKIPKPFEFGTIFGTVPTSFYRWYSSENESANDVAKTMVQQLSSNIGFTVIPPALVPMIENYFNIKLYTGQPLVSRGKLGLDPSLQYNGSTGEVSKYLGGKKIIYNFETGQWEGIPPVILENYLTSYGGPLGTYLLMAADYMTTLGGVEKVGAATPVSKYPVIRRFIADAKDQNPAGADNLYTMIGMLDEVNRTMSYLRKIGDAEGMKAYVEDKKPILRAAPTIKALKKVASNIRKMDTAVNESKTMTADEKLQELRRINELEARYLDDIRKLKRELGL